MSSHPIVDALKTAHRRAEAAELRNKETEVEICEVCIDMAPAQRDFYFAALPLIVFYV